MAGEGKLLLLTGATGFIGCRTLIHALEAGYTVRAAIRKESKAASILSTPALKELNLPPSALTFSIVPDITVEGAYNEAMKDVTHVIHVASPLSTQNKEGHLNSDEVFIRPAVNGVLQMLKAAKASPKVRKVVITSSVVAIMPPIIFGGFQLSDVHYTAENRTENIDGPYSAPGTAYCASKIAALNATDDWVAREKPPFDIVNVHPSWVLGPTDLVQDREEFLQGTNVYLTGVALGNPEQYFTNRRLTGCVVHVDDVAKVHVKALSDDVNGYRGFIASVPGDWEDIPKYVAEHFQEQVKSGLFRTDADQTTARIDLDGTDTEKALDIKFKPFSELIRDTLNSYISLPEKA